MSRRTAEVRADASLRQKLESLLPDTQSTPSRGINPAVADVMLARIVWSHVLEPGDAVAGALIARLGAVSAIELVVSRASGAELHAALRTHGADEVTLRQASAAVKRWAPRVDRAAVLADIERARSFGMRIVIPGSAHWSTALDDLGVHAPVLLWANGDTSLLSSQSLAVVGARASTGYGTHVTAELTGEACTAGFTIVSGAAYGVDAVAHRTALALQAPTIAVLAGGVDRPYPSAHTRLLEQIAACGVVCSEMLPGSAPTRWRFLQRNRVIAALARATLVTEAGPRSGSLNTAGHAAELGRALGAVPGPITSAASVGCHRLVREYGASLITNGRELRELLEVSEETTLSRAAHGEPERESALHQRVVDALPLRGTRAPDDVARRAGIAPDEARAALVELELLGSVRRRDSPGGSEELWGLERGQ